MGKYPDAINDNNHINIVRILLLPVKFSWVTVLS
jgi:hypothetical protein